MSQGLPRIDLAALPPDVLAAVAANVAALQAEQAARAHLEAELQDLAARAFKTAPQIGLRGRTKRFGSGDMTGACLSQPVSTLPS